jgi:hypothetical protein
MKRIKLWVIILAIILAMLLCTLAYEAAGYLWEVGHGIGM